MPHRHASPAVYDNDLDIAKALVQEAGGPEDSAASDGHFKSEKEHLMAVESGDDDGDEMFIKAQQAAAHRRLGNAKIRTAAKGGGFQAMGLNIALLKAITRKGFSVPTPIQRKTIPLLLDGRDVVGMARTGSGKTAAFLIPLIEKLKTHSAKVGARAVILSPSRELALQTLKVGKELMRGTDLRSILLVGGDSLEEQFSSMTVNPDVIIATPGRFLHLKVEMGLDLSSVEYMVFDEADRLFEMGFAAQLSEILHALPTSRQTLLFSATLPKSLVEFARAGLQEPVLVRLDAESKTSSDLESAFFLVKTAEKEGALLHILHDIIKMPLGETEAGRRLKKQATEPDKKRKRESDNQDTAESPTMHSTVIFVATKHHVEYIAALLRSSGYAVSHAYGSLDQTARKMQVYDFRNGITNILVVTDVAARGIDIPMLSNVINYDFPPQPKIFVHRVGRTARAGKRGWSYSLIKNGDMPYLLDLQLFLGKRLVVGRTSETVSFAKDIVVGAMPRNKLERSCEETAKLLDESDDLAALRAVAAKGEKLYSKTRNSASTQSVKRAKEVQATKGAVELNSLFEDDTGEKDLERDRMLSRVSAFRPQETVFELGKRGRGEEAAAIMRRRREKISSRRLFTAAERLSVDGVDIAPSAVDAAPDQAQETGRAWDGLSDDELEVTYADDADHNDKADNDPWQESEYFMSYIPKETNMAEERAYGVGSGSYQTGKENSSFMQAAKVAAMDLTNDETKAFAESSKSRGLRWDKKSKKYVARANDEDGSKGARMVRGESGQKIAASFKSGRFDAWRKSNKIERLPRTGELEAVTRRPDLSLGKKYKYRSERAPKAADRFRDDFHKQKRRVEEAREKRIGKFKEGGGRNELRSIDDVRKQRKLTERRKAKTGRPARKTGDRQHR